MYNHQLTHYLPLEMLDLQQEMFYHSVDGGPFVIEAGPLPLRCEGGMSSMEIGQFPTRSRGIVQTFLHTEGTSCVAGCDDMCRRLHLFERCRWNCSPMQLIEYERNIEDASHLCRQTKARPLQNTLIEPAIFEMSFFWRHVCHL